MSKSILTIIADDDIIDELATYPYHRCHWVTEADDIPDDIKEIIDNDDTKYEKRLAEFAINKLRANADALELEWKEEET